MFKPFWTSFRFRYHQVIHQRILIIKGSPIVFWALTLLHYSVCHLDRDCARCSVVFSFIFTGQPPVPCSLAGPSIVWFYPHWMKIFSSYQASPRLLKIIASYSNWESFLSLLSYTKEILVLRFWPSELFALQISYWYRAVWFNCLRWGN